MALNEDFYQNFHKFRLEWEPPIDDDLGYGGYIKWFVDGKLVTAVYGDDLQATSQSEIPSEPMYLVMNLAVSKDWGFPDAYFKNCPKKCWSCLDPECACALPKRFCGSIPTSLEIESVRVYQPVVATAKTTSEAGATTSSSNGPRYSIGCSPPHRPTKEFIEARKEAYKLRAEENPLKVIAIGGGACRTDWDCGPTARHGICSQNNATCICGSNWTGPKCLASSGFSGEWTTDPYYFLSRNSNELEWGAFTILFLLCVSAIIVLQYRYVAWNNSKKHTYRVLATMSSNGSDDMETPRESPLPAGSYQHGGYIPNVSNINELVAG